MDAGINPVQMLNRYRDSPDFQRKIHELFCRILDLGDGTSHDELVRKAQDRWGYATAQDHTMMFQDVNVVVQYINDILVPRQFLIHAINDYLRVINEVGDEHITTIRGLLKHVDVGQRVRFLYLSGHGIPGSVASALAESPANDETNKSKVWHRWDLRWCL